VWLSVFVKGGGLGREQVLFLSLSLCVCVSVCVYVCVCVCLHRCA